MLHGSGNGTPVTAEAAISCNELRAQRLTNNLHVLERLREDEHAESLFATCVDDAEKARMTMPSLVTEQVVADFSVSPRFGVHQGGKVFLLCAFRLIVVCAVSGLKADGSEKIRAVDDMSISGVNAATAATEKLHCDTLDTLVQTMQALHAAIPVQF